MARLTHPNGVVVDVDDDRVDLLLRSGFTAEKQPAKKSTAKQSAAKKSR